MSRTPLVARGMAMAGHAQDVCPMTGAQTGAFPAFVVVQPRVFPWLTSDSVIGGRNLGLSSRLTQVAAMRQG